MVRNKKSSWDASIIKWKPAQRTSNTVTSQGHRRQPNQNEHFPNDSWFSQPQRTSTAVPVSSTAPTPENWQPEAHAYHLNRHPVLWHITPGEHLCLLISRGSASKHSPPHRAAGVWRVSDPKADYSTLPPTKPFLLSFLLQMDPIYWCKMFTEVAGKDQMKNSFFWGAHRTLQHSNGSSYIPRKTACVEKPCW